MSRSFDAADDYLSVASTPVSGVPLTLAAHVLPNNTATTKSILTVGTDGSANNRFSLECSGAEAITALSRTSTNATATSSASASTSVWNHAAAVFTSSTGRAAFLNGGNKGTDATSNSPSASDCIYSGTAPNLSADYSGLIAHPAIWNVALTDNEIAALAAGISPLAIRPGALVFYAPYLGRDATEIDIIGGRLLTVTGATASSSEPPALWMPRRRIWIPVAGGGSYSVDVTETASAADTLSSAATLAASVSEAASAADAYSSAATLAAAVAEAVSAADSVSADAATYAVDIAEAASLTDAISSVLTAAAAVAESASAADTVSSVATLIADLAEAVTATDLVSTGGSTYAVDVAEAIAALDAFSAQFNLAAAVAEAVSASDSTASLATLAAAVTEAIAAADSATAAGIFGVTITESANAADSVSAPTGFGETPASRTITVQRGDRTITVRLTGRTISVH